MLDLPARKPGCTNQICSVAVPFYVLMAEIQFCSLKFKTLGPHVSRVNPCGDVVTNS